MKLATALAILLIVAAVPALATPPSAAGPGQAAGSGIPESEAPREIAALLSLLRVSPCRFQRNGRWYDGEKAAAHLQRKLDYAIGHGQAIGSTERFIDQAASASSLSGRAYYVQCGEAPKVPARTWFHRKLAGLRD